MLILVGLMNFWKLFNAVYKQTFFHLLSFHKELYVLLIVLDISLQKTVIFEIV